MTTPSNRSLRSPRAGALLVVALALTGTPAVLSLASAPLAAQEVQATGRITGTVTTTGGLPVDNVQVAVVGTRLGALTGADGRFAIAGVPVGARTVRAQRIGYAMREQQVTVTEGQPAVADFQMESRAVNLEAVVTVGYTTQQRRDVSDATAGVRAEEIRDQPVATVEEALRGRIPGVQIAASGEPGRPAQVIIRGQNFLGNPSPLYVVDGMYVQQNPNLNPDDIESIEVLKDASAAAQYGAQAANGVVVIRTKRGQGGDNRIEVRSYYGFQSVPSQIDMMNSTQWAALTREAYTNAGLPVIAGALGTPSVNTDWQDAVFTRGSIQDHNLSIGGGGQNANYLISGGYTRQDGAIIQTDFERYSFRVNSEARRGRLTFGENVAISSTRRTFLDGFPLIDVLRFPPSVAVRDTSVRGGFAVGTNEIPTFGTNPVGALMTRDNDGRSNQVLGSAYGELALFRGLRYRLNLGLNYDDFRQRDFTSRALIRFRGPDDPARLNSIQSDHTSLLLENLLMYDGSFAEGAHRLNAVAGYTEQRQSLDRLTAYREGYSNEDLQVIDAGGAANQSNSGNRLESALQALLFRANYTFRDRYLLTGSIRRDGSSRFGPSNRYGTFGAGSVGWVLSEEGFYQGIPLLGRGVNYFKLRGSYGVLGNQDIGDYRFSAPINQNLNYLFANSAVNSGAIQLGLANPNIKWQSNKQGNVGLDLGLLGDRLTVTADFYRSESEGLLVEAPIPWSLGATGVPVVNAGTVRNTGFELGANHRAQLGALQLNTSLNLTTTNNKVVALGNGGQPIFVNGPDNVPLARTTVGEAIGSFYVFRTAGIFQSDAEVQAWTTSVGGTAKVIQPGAKAGDVKFVDINQDGVLNDADRYNAGSAIPDLVAGLFLDGKYRAFDFGVNLRGSWGSEIFNAARWWTDRVNNVSNFRQDFRPWTTTNRSTTTPIALADGPRAASNARVNSDRWIESGSYLRLQNILLGYTLPAGFARNVGLRSAQPRVYVNMQNLHTFTDYSGWDPEVLGFGNALARGIDDGAIYPNVRTITFGLDLRF